VSIFHVLDIYVHDKFNVLQSTGVVVPFRLVAFTAEKVSVNVRSFVFTPVFSLFPVCFLYRHLGDAVMFNYICETHTYTHMYWFRDFADWFHGFYPARVRKSGSLWRWKHWSVRQIKPAQLAFGRTL